VGTGKRFLLGRVGKTFEKFAIVKVDPARSLPVRSGLPPIFAAAEAYNDDDRSGDPYV
jgi:hypothetical protein